MWWYIYVTIPHLVYTVSYHYGDLVVSYIPFSVFMNACIYYRLLFYPLTTLYAYQTVFHTWNILTWFSPNPFFMIGICLILIGLCINSVIYKKMGIEGVYYGCEMINKCTYITGFPYNCINHPMYTAAIILVIGTAFLMGIDVNYGIRLNVWIPLSYVVLLYMYSIMIENQPSLVYKRIKNI